MRPRLNAGEYLPGGAVYIDRPTRFNEAPAECRGIPAHGRAVEGVCIASMRPRLNAGEYLDQAADLLRRRLRLQ